MLDKISSINVVIKNVADDTYDDLFSKVPINYRERVQHIATQVYKYIQDTNDKIENISSILPVLKSPTILPLAEEGWSSLHSVIDKNQFWNVIDELKSAGAEGILVIPIEKMVL